jgi:hypothetical protein
VLVVNSHWILTKIPFSRSRFANFFIATVCLGVIYFVATAIVAHSAQQSPNVVLLDAPAAVYAPDPNDSWNKIFFYLFSRRVETRVTDEFPESRGAAPFTRQENPRVGMLPSSVGISARSFERDEVGDQAIDPLYPSFLRSTGAQVVLNDPAYSELSKALQQALGENAFRPPVARALMQADLWSAYDTLYSTPFSQRPMPETEQRRALLDLLARLILKIALTDREVESLPANYSAAAPLESLPDLFRKDGEWLEVRWMPHLHDYAAGNRRVTRVFLKSVHPPRDVNTFLNGLPRDEHLLADLDGVALVTQLLLIDAKGRLLPTSLTTDVQVRLFEKMADGTFKRTSIQASEISRRLLINSPPSGGLVVENGNDPAYLAIGGNDYTFASLHPHLGTAVQAKLRTRCTACHGDQLTVVLTFAFESFPNGCIIPPVRQLNPAAHQAADAVIEKKAKQKDFESLQAFFNGDQ